MFFLPPQGLSVCGFKPIAQSPQDIEFRVLFRRDGLSLVDGVFGNRLLLDEIGQLGPQGVAILTDLQQSHRVESTGMSALLLSVRES
ncbi:MAG: hypothetical protein FD138_170 [Planctomycetota bacterium]|nr:MAG: hypothetical protein FD138_170 [Planctomycetota bacterium]